MRPRGHPQRSDPSGHPRIPVYQAPVTPAPVAQPVYQAPVAPAATPVTQPAAQPATTPATDRPARNFGGFSF